MYFYWNTSLWDLFISLASDDLKEINHQKRASPPIVATSSPIYPSLYDSLWLMLSNFIWIWWKCFIAIATIFTHHSRLHYHSATKSKLAYKVRHASRLSPPAVINGCRCRIRRLNSKLSFSLNMCLLSPHLTQTDDSPHFSPHSNSLPLPGIVWHICSLPQQFLVRHASRLSPPAVIIIVRLNP